jgi:hypothetical protein
MTNTKLRKGARRIALSDDERSSFVRLRGIDPGNWRNATQWIRALTDADPAVTLGTFTSLVDFWGRTKERGYSRHNFNCVVKPGRRAIDSQRAGNGAGAATPAHRLAEVMETHPSAARLNREERETLGRLLNVAPSGTGQDWIAKLVSTDPSITGSVYEALAAVWGVAGSAGYSRPNYYRVVGDYRVSVGLPRQMGVHPRRGKSQRADVGLAESAREPKRAHYDGTTGPVTKELVKVVEWMREYNVDNILLDSSSGEVLLSNQPSKKEPEEVNLTWKLA